MSAELEDLRAWLGEPPRHPHQTHGIDQSDAEVVRLADGLFIALSVDAIAEELALGLYDDPFTVGWVSAVAGLADIAAVGANPVGVLLAAVYTPGWSLEARARVGAGFAAALRDAGTALLGGDTGSADCPVISVTAIGTCAEPPMSRIGAGPGDILCVTGGQGSAAALATRKVLGLGSERYPEHLFRPRARLSEGSQLRALASACTDASDGLLGAVATLARLNGLGASLTWNPDAVDQRAAEYFAGNDLPLWLAWWAEVGDYELVLAVPETRWRAACAAVPSLRRIGHLTTSTEITLATESATFTLDLAGRARFATADRGEHAALLRQAVTDMRTQGLP